LENVENILVQIVDFMNRPGTREFAGSLWCNFCTFSLMENQEIVIYNIDDGKNYGAK